MSELKVTQVAKLRLRSNFALNHLRVAIRHAQSAHAVEQNTDTSQFGSWFDDMMMHVPVAIVMAAAALEANSNEIIQDVLDGFRYKDLTEANRALLNDLRIDRSGNAIGKYRKLGLLLDKMPATDGASWQNADLLFRFRNSFMHFKPAWDNETDIHDGALVRGLRSRVPITPAYQSNFMFPFGFMTYGCAKWAVESVLTFSAEFSALIVVPDTFADGTVLP